MPPARDAKADDDDDDAVGLVDLCWKLEPIPRRSAALAVPSAVKAPEALRTESMAGTRFLRGDVAGVEKESDDFRDREWLWGCDWEWECACGEGVRLRLFAR